MIVVLLASCLSGRLRRTWTKNRKLKTEFNKTGQEARTASTKFVFFEPIGQPRWLPWPLIGWYIFDFFSETAERNSINLDRKQYLKILYQVWGFQTDRKTKMAAIASDLLKHFQLLVWNRWMEFNITWQEARSQCPLTSLCGFFGPIGKPRWPPWPLAETFSTSCLKPLNGIQRNLTGSKISTSSTKCCLFFGWSENKNGRPGIWLSEIFSTSSLQISISMCSIKKRYSGARLWPFWPLDCPVAFAAQGRKGTTYRYFVRLP